MLQALDALVRGRGLARTVELARGRLVERVDQERGLAAAGDAGDAGEETERDLGGDVLEIVAARTDHPQGPSQVRGPPLRNRNRALAREIFAGDRRGRGHEIRDAALRDDLTAVDPGAGADVDHVIGGADRILVVLDHQHRVAEVAQALERLEQPRVVALMQPDRGLVQNVEHAGEPRADLRGEPDALALAAGERAGRARRA